MTDLLQGDAAVFVERRVLEMKKLSKTSSGFAAALLDRLEKLPLTVSWG